MLLTPIGTKQRLWNPGLANDHLTLGQVYKTLPGDLPTAIDPLVRLFENPSSPMAFRGAITLERHDCVHILLGRGLLGQDEAFVLGFTMGAEKNVPLAQVESFRTVARWLYSGANQFREADLRVFDLGRAAAKAMGTKPLSGFAFERHMDMPIGLLRRRLGIDTAMLRTIYRAERVLAPETPESARLAA